MLDCNGMQTVLNGNNANKENTVLSLFTFKGAVSDSN